MSNRSQPSTFQKIAIAFLLLGVLPLLVVCLTFFRRYESNMRLTIESNMEEANYYAQTKIADLVGSIDRSMEYLYDYSDGDWAALYEVLEDETISENERRMHLGLFLDYFINTNPAVSAAYFVDSGGTTYYRFYSQEKSLRPTDLGYHVLPEADGSRQRQLFILPATEESDWVNGSQDTVLSLGRNYIDTRSLKAELSAALGTLYIDVGTDAIDELFSLPLGAEGNIAIVDGSTGQVLYQLRETAVPLPEGELLYGGSSFDDEGHTVFYQPIEQSAYHLLVSFDRQELYSTYASNRTFLFLLLATAVIVILVLGLVFSGRMSRPARQLQQAMEQVQQGNLNVRVEITSRDEMEELGRGFNHMVEELADTIAEVYLAELCQRNAELNALKMQVQPHYLYNTLDIIRMSALEQQDSKTARLIESLSRQLRYVIGDHRERVALRQELDNLHEYAVLLDARYEGRIRLSIEVHDEELSLMVPKLLLQPFVENAIKHGLRDKQEGGTVLIEVARATEQLQIMVLNDGNPIESQRLAHIRQFLATAAVGVQDEAGIVSVGMKNTYDRIKLNCGAEYGFTIDSDEVMGVIVTIRLPIWRNEYVEGSAG